MAQVEPFMATNKLQRLGSGETTLIPTTNEMISSKTFRYPNSQAVSAQGSILPAVAKEPSIKQKLKKYSTVQQEPGQLQITSSSA